MGRLKSVGQAQRFLSNFEPIRGHFHPQQHKQTASEYRAAMHQRIESWRSLTGIGATGIGALAEPLSENRISRSDDAHSIKLS